MNQVATSASECPPPGVYENVPFEEYLRWAVVDASMLKAAGHTLNYAKWKREHQEEEKQAYLKGRLFHFLALEDKDPNDYFIVKPPTYHHPSDPPDKFRPWSGNAKECKSWIALMKSEALTIVKSEMWDEAAGMADRVRNHPYIGPMVKKAKTELSGVWIDRPSGLTMKVRFDAICGGIVVDLKSTSKSAYHQAFFSEAQKHRYHIQAAVNIDAAKALNLIPSEKPGWFCFVVVEAYPPFDLCAFDVQDDIQALSYDYLDYGRRKYRELLGKVAEAEESGVWPGHPEESVDMELTFAAEKELLQMRGEL